MSESEMNVRRLRYRLSRQGMLELDTWLSPLLQQAGTDDENVVSAIELLLQCEAPQLQLMMAGDAEVPEVLKRWLCR